MNAGWRAALERYPSSSRPPSALDVEPLGNAGGLSGARLWRFPTGRGPMVVRCWPRDGPDRGHLGRIHAWLIEAGDLAFVPVPIPALDGRTVVESGGRLWEVAPWMPGEADLSRPPAPPRVRAAFAGLAAMLARLASSRHEGPSPGLAGRVGEIEGLIRGEFDSIRAAIDRHRDDPHLPFARRWLDRAAALAPRVLSTVRQVAERPLPLQPCLRDARPDHFLFEGDRLSGLVDFGAMGQDSVAGDLARLLAEAIGSDRLARAEALAAFESIRPLGEFEIRAIEAFERANSLLGAGRWVRWHFLDRRQFEEPDAVLRGLRRGLERIEALDPITR